MAGERGQCYAVPGSCLTLCVGPHCSPGYLCPAFPHALLGQADNPRRLVVHHDDSVVRSCAYPCTTLLGGIHWWIQCDRLSRPLHSVESQLRPWGVCIILASRREELHLYSLQVIKDLVVFDPSSLASGPFRGNGSQRPLEHGLQDVFHFGDELARRLGNAPGLYPPRLQFVVFRRAPTAT
jgi:hypothetical protein